MKLHISVVYGSSVIEISETVSAYTDREELEKNISEILTAVKRGLGSVSEFEDNTKRYIANIIKNYAGSGNYKVTETSEGDYLVTIEDDDDSDEDKDNYKDTAYR